MATEKVTNLVEEVKGLTVLELAFPPPPPWR